MKMRSFSCINFMARKESITNEEYTYTVHYTPAEEGGYVVHVPALDISTEGETLEEARDMVIDAIEGHLEVPREHHWSTPVEDAVGQPVSEILRVKLKTV